MKATDLDPQDLLGWETTQGCLYFTGQRSLIVDTVALGVFRKELVKHLGITATRTLITHYGFAEGWRRAEAMKSKIIWEKEEELLFAGLRIPMFQGMYRIVSPDWTALKKEGLQIEDSFEAEQYLANHGRSETAVCWVICGFLSGYLSFIEGKEIYVLEDQCAGRGHHHCRLRAAGAEEWGKGHKDLDFFRPANFQNLIDTSLQTVIAELKQCERKLRSKKQLLRRAAPEGENPSGTLFHSPIMRQVVDLARKIAKVDSSVLITGESGTGKERIARLVHDESSRSGGPFIAVNCSAITETLLESEFFGHTKGSFTGASKDRPGLFEEANGGTIMLDEIAEVPPNIQVKLLRALQEHEIRRVGENKSRPIDVRVIAATNRDLLKDLDSGRFRNDLYYRLRVVELHLPPLRERQEDILPLARIFLHEASVRLKMPAVGLAPEAADLLLRYNWPGNVRELENVMERAIALARASHIEREDLPEEVRLAERKVVITSDGKTLAEMEKEYILACLKLNGGNQAKTAAHLGIGNVTLYRKLKSYRASEAGL